MKTPGGRTAGTAQRETDKEAEERGATPIDRGAQSETEGLASLCDCITMGVDPYLRWDVGS